MGLPWTEKVFNRENVLKMTAVRKIKKENTLNISVKHNEE